MRKGGTIMGIGDSLTRQGVSYLAPYGAYMQLVQQYINAEYSAVNLIIKGLGGSQTESYANNLMPLIGMSASEVDLVMIQLGTNDGGNGTSTTNFKANMVKIIDFIRRQNKTCHIFLGGPPRLTTLAAGNGYNKADTEWNAIRAECDAIAALYTNVHAVHLETCWTAADSATYLIDGIHPNNAGHVKLAEKMYAKIEEQMPAWLASLG